MAHKFNISYSTEGKDPEEVQAAIKKTLKNVMKSGKLGDIDPDSVQIHDQTTGTRWDLTLETGKDGCTCPVEVHLCGIRGDANPLILKKTKDDRRPFFSNQTDVFSVFLDDSIGDIFKIRLGFPKDVKDATWDLKSFKLQNPGEGDIYQKTVKVTVKVSATQDPWLELPIVWPDYPNLQGITYHVYVHTHVKSGRMDSGVHVVIYGDFGNTGQRWLKKSLTSKVMFQTAAVDRYEVQAVKMGELRKCLVINDCNGANRNWMLDKVTVKEDPQAEKEWVFKCSRMFDPNRGDRKTQRILLIGRDQSPEPEEDLPEPVAPPPKKKPAKKVTLPPEEKPKPKPKEPEPEPEPEEEPEPEKPKEKPKKEKPKPKPKVPDPEPEPEPEEEPEPEPEKPKEKPKKEKPKPKPKPKPKEEEPEEDYPNNAWELWWENRPKQNEYKDIPITLVLVGDNGSSEEIPLSVTLKAGQSQRYKIECDPDDVGELLKCRIQFANSDQKKLQWEIAKLHILHLKSDEMSTFMFSEKGLQAKGDQTIEGATGNIPIRQYVVELYTGDRPGLVTGKARVYVIVRGETGDTGKRWIVNPEDGLDGLKKGEVYSYELECVDVGEVKGIKIGHNQKDKEAAWFLEKAIVKPKHRADLQYVFKFDRPSDQIETKATTEEQANEYYDPKEWMISWTNAPGQVHDFRQITANLFGDKGTSKSYYIDVELKPGDSDGYKIAMDQDIGHLEKIRMGHGPKVKGKVTPWLIEEVRAKHLATGETYKFRLGGSGGEDNGMRKYRIETYMGKGAAALGNAKVYIKLTGETVTTDKCWLGRSMNHTASFLPGQVDQFEIEMPDLGEIKNMRIGHNKKHKQIGHFVEKVIIRPIHLPNKEYVFKVPLVETPPRRRHHSTLSDEAFY